MPASKKQIEANRRNAQKSTGPKTADGKAAVAQNAVKHGLLSRQVVINAPRLRENPEEFEALYEELYAELQPETTFQELLVNKIAVSLWRSRRAVIAETGRISEQIRELESGYDKRVLELRCNDRNFTDENEYRENCEMVYANRIGMCSVPHDCRDILYYEMRLDRQMTRAYHLLQFLKSQHKNGSHPERNNELTEPEPAKESESSLSGPDISPPQIHSPDPAICGEEAPENFKKAKTKPISSNRKEA